MKKFLIILSIIFIILIGLLVAIPVFFKDDIVAAADKEIEKNISADVYFDADKIGISLFKRFPDLTLTLNDFGVVGIDQFEGDTLVSIDVFDVTADLKSVIFGDKIIFRSINLVNPSMTILILEDGTTNYDIAVKREEEPPEEADTTQSALNIGIESWSIRNGRLAYYDMSSGLLMAIEGLNHSGSGDFSMNVFDMNTSTEIENMMVSLNGVKYLENKKLVADITLNMNMNESKYTFRQNSIALNDFKFGFEGYFAMPDDNYDMDISFEGKDNSVKSLLSLVPGAFKEGYEEVKATGTLNFNGYIKGIYNESQNRMPAFNLKLITQDGLIRYPDLPDVMKNININLMIDNKDGNIENTVVDLSKFHIEFGNNPIDASVKVKNLSNYDLVADIKADLDLGNVMKIYPLEDTELRGTINAGLHAEGVYDSVSMTIPASGILMINNFKYVSKDFPQGFGINSSTLALNTKKINVKNFNGYAGNTDLNLSGTVSNYIGYALMENEMLTGEFNFQSKLVDLNEWMTKDTTAVEETDTAHLEVVEVPGNIDFVLKSSIDKILYDNLELMNATGNIIVRDGVIRMDNLAFNTLGGDFAIGGTYNTQDMDHPKFDFSVSIQHLAIPKAYQSFVTVQKLAPIAQIMEGNFSTDLKMGGELQRDMMPAWNTLSADGILKIVQAAVKGTDSKVISGVTSLTKLSGESTNVTLRDVLVSTQVRDGRVFIEPFNVKFGNNNAIIAGSHGLDGSMNYTIKMDVPPGAVQTVTQLASSLAGKNFNVNSKDVKINLGIKGTFDKPEIKVLGLESGGTAVAAKEALKAKVQEQKEKVTEEAEKVVEEKKEEIKQQAEDEIAKKKEEAKEEVNKELDKAKDKLKDLFKKKGN